MAEPPTAEQFFGAGPGQAPTPTVGAPPTSLPTAAQFFSEAAQPQSGAAHDTIWSSLKDAGGRILNSAGYGFQDAWGSRPLGLAPDAEDALGKLGVINDYKDGHTSFMKSANEAVIRPAASVADWAMRAPSAVLRTAAAGLGQTAREISGEQTPATPGQAPSVREAIAAPFAAAGELSAGVSEGALLGEFGVPQEINAGARTAAADASVNDAAAARSVGVLGEGEAGFYDAAPVTPEAVAARASAAQEAGLESPAPQTPPPDVHALARRIDPETFQEYDALNAETALHRDTIQRMGQERETSPEALAAQADIDTLLGRVRGVEGRLTKAAAARLSEAQARLDAATSIDTPEMAQARDRLISADFAMRDLAPDVAAAYRSAREIAPTLPEDAAAAEAEAREGEKGSGATGGAQTAEGAPAPAQEAVAKEPAQTPGALAVGASAEGEAAVAPPNVLGEALGAEGEKAEASPATEPGSAINPRALGNPRAVQGTGETVTRGLSREVEASAVENELVSSFGELPEYQRLNMQDQAERAVAFMDRDYEAAKDVAMGRRQPPADLHPVSVAVAVEKRATAEGDVATLQRLANSPLATRVTTAAQTIRILGERDKGSPLEALQELQRAREVYAAKSMDIAQEKAQAVAEIKAEVRAAASKPDAWANFVQSITCSE